MTAERTISDIAEETFHDSHCGCGSSEKVTTTAPLPAGILSAIERQGAHPFIVVRVPGFDEEVLFCPSQNERLGFAATLAEAARSIGGSLLLDALAHILRHQIYRAASALFEWSTADSPGRIIVFDDTTKPFPAYGHWPIYDLDPASSTTFPEPGLMLKAGFGAYEASHGNDQTRLWFLEAFGFALSRFCGLSGQFEEGLDFVGRVKKHGSTYQHLAACAHVLDLKRRGLPVPARLEKFAGRENGSLNDFVCTFPYKQFDITRGGNVRNCCLVPNHIGNFAAQAVPEIINSEVAIDFRQSVLDGSYRYCDHLHCKLMINNALPRKNSLEVMSDPVMRAAVEQGRTRVDSIPTLYFSYDISWNLSCPSCRRDVIIENLQNTVASKVLALLPRVSHLLFSGGEAFFSKPARKLLRAIDPTACPELKITIISNGTLLSEAEWEKFSHLSGMIHCLRISTDAARPETFEILRRRGRWTRFYKNLQFLGRLRAANDIKFLTMSFTYQVANFREMKAFIRLVESVGADCAIFEVLYPNFEAMTESEYLERAVHRIEHPDHKEFLEIIADSIFRQNNVNADFEY
jgi:iron-sulfur cluster protein